MAGTDFVSNIKKNGVAFLAIAFLTCVIGGICVAISVKFLGIPVDLSLAFFLMQAGVKGGAGFVEIVSQYGIKLFLAGVMMTSVTTIVSFIISYKLFKLPLFAALGTTTGSMTSAPSLGTLLDVTRDDKVSSFYAACQPVATVLFVFLPQIIVIIFGI